MSTATHVAEATHLTAPNLDIEASNGVTYAYRRFGTPGDRRPPLLFLQHLRGNRDTWDPMLGDAIAARAE